MAAVLQESEAATNLTDQARPPRADERVLIPTPGRLARLCQCLLDSAALYASAIHLSHQVESAFPSRRPHLVRAWIETVTGRESIASGC
jgi:hypothetical protein